MGVFIAVTEIEGGQLRKLGRRIDPNIAGRNWDFLTRRNRDSKSGVPSTRRVCRLDVRVVIYVSRPPRRRGRDHRRLDCYQVAHWRTMVRHLESREQSSTEIPAEVSMVVAWEKPRRRASG